jgi:hypothetical protein
MLAWLVLEVVIFGGEPPSLGALIAVVPILVFITVYMVIFVALGVLWALWHLPTFFNPDLHYSDLPFVVQLAFQILVAILFTWVFNSTGAAC